MGFRMLDFRLCALASLLVIGSCSQAKPAPEESSAPAQALAGRPAAEAPGPRKLVRTVDLAIRASDAPAVAEQLKALAPEFGGYVSSFNADRIKDALHYSVTLRVSVGRLDEAVDRIKRLASRIDRESSKVEDVTDRYVDLEARLKTLTATEGELRQLLSESRERRSSADEIMTIYGKLIEIRSSIEQIQGQINLLEKLTDLATINVRLSPAEDAQSVVGDGWRPLETARRSLRALLGGLRFLGDMAIGLVIVVLPIALILGLAVRGSVGIARRVGGKKRGG